MGSTEINRRPLKSRSAAWAKRTAAFLSRTSATPNQISVASVIFALVGATSVLVSGAPWSLLVCAVCIQLRLVCNLLDGMVAIEGSKRTATGGLYNEITDRISDSLIIVAIGYVASRPWLGWLGALLAVLTAYIRTLGGSLGLAQDFRGAMAKPHRMAVLTAASSLGALEAARWHSGYVLTAAEWVVSIGGIVTCVTRTRAIARRLQDASSA